MIRTSFQEIKKEVPKKKNYKRIEISNICAMEMLCLKCFFCDIGPNI